MKKSIKNLGEIKWRYILTELVLIVVGILLAINLNSWSANLKTKKQTKLSIAKIRDEVELNITELTEVLEANSKLNEFYTEIITLRSNEIGTIACSIEKMNSLKDNYNGQFIIKDSIKLDANKYEYRLNLNFELEYGELNEIAWKSAQMSNNVNEYPYGCLTSILSVYGFQETYTEVQKKFLDYSIVKDTEVYIVTFRLCHSMGMDLLARYKDLSEEIKNCS